MAFKGNGPEVTNLDAGNLASGTVATARLGSGTANSTTYLRGDQTWATVSGGVTSLNGQTGAITNTNIDAIGATMNLFYTGTGTTSLNTPLFLAINTTIAGSSLRYNPSSIGRDYSKTCVSKENSTTWTFGGTALSGTWRVMETALWFYNANRSGSYEAFWYQILVVRIS